MNSLQLLLNHAVLLCALLPWCLSVSCSDGGGDISVVDNKITGLVVDTSRGPAAGVPVYLRPHDYLANGELLGKRMLKLANGVCSTSTNENGEFNFTTGDSITAGTYVIEAVGDEGKTRALVDGVEIDSVLLDSRYWLRITTPEEQIVLRPAATITGKVLAADSVRGYVMVSGLDVMEPIGNDGSYSLVNVPAGNLQIIIHASLGGTGITDTVLALVAPGATQAVTETFALTYRYFPYRGTGLLSVTDPRTYADGDTAILSEPIHELPPKLFSGWNTLSDGTGAMYQPGDGFIISKEALEVFGIWVDTTTPVLTLRTNGKGNVAAAFDLASDTNRIVATPDSGHAFVKWNVVEGDAEIVFTESLSTIIILKKKNAVIEGIFERTVGSFYGVYNLDSLFGYCSNESFASLQLPDGSYVVSGVIYKYDNNATQASGAPALSIVYLLKLGADGGPLWNRVYYTLTGHSRVFSIAMADDNGFILAGETTENVQTDYDMLIMKTDPEGKLMWTTKAGGAGLQRAEAVIPVKGNGYMASGITIDEYNNDSLYIVKFKGDGSIEWEKSIPELYGGNAIVASGDSLFLIPATKSESAHGNGTHLVSINSKGEVLGDTLINALVMEKFLDVKALSNGKIRIVGSTVADGIFLVETNASGDSLLQQPLYNSTIYVVNKVQCLDDGGFILTGESSTLFLLKIDETGTRVWERTFGITGMYHSDYGNTVFSTIDGGYFVTGQISWAVPEKNVLQGVWPVMVIKTDAAGLVK